MSTQSRNIISFESAVRGQLPPGRLLVCVSGGADSTALLHCCVRLGRDCHAVHCDFHLRGAESERDRRFVSWICRRLGVPLHVEHFDVPAYMRSHGVSLEMACRDLRYDLFARLRRELDCTRIVVAHNADDNAETMFLNLFRGTGLKGLCGMEPDTGDILRPLLAVSRREIESYLDALGVRHITVSSNNTSDVRRNYIRNELIPAIEDRWPGLRKAMNRTSRNLSDALRICDSVLTIGDPLFLPAAQLDGCAAPSMLVHRFLEGRGASDTQIRDIASSRRPGARWQLPACTVERDAAGLHIVRPSAGYPELVSDTTRPYSPSLLQELRHSDPYVLYIDADVAGLHWRSPRRGERMKPFGMKGSRMVSDIIHDARLDPQRRSAVRLLADAADNAVWIPGVRRSSLYPVNEATRLIRIIRVRP